MGYPIITDFETGPHVAAWERAIEGELRGETFSIPFASKEQADAFRYRMHATRANAEKARHPLAEQTRHFMLKIVELNGAYVLQCRASKGIIGDVDLRTRKEREEDAAREKQALEMTARLASLGGTAPKVEEAEALFARVKKGEAVPKVDLERARSVLPALDAFLGHLEKNSRRSGDALQG